MKNWAGNLLLVALTVAAATMLAMHLMNSPRCTSEEVEVQKTLARKQNDLALALRNGAPDECAARRAYVDALSSSGAFALRCGLGDRSGATWRDIEAQASFQRRLVAEHCS